MDEQHEKRTGRLFVFEGIDGSGKTTQRARVAEALRARGLPVVELFEPSDSPSGRRIRAIARGDEPAVTPEEELELFLEDRRENVARHIGPALAGGALVLLDRYYFSTIAYQGARGLDPDAIRRRNEAFAPPPDRVFYFRIDAPTALARIERARGRPSAHFERRDYLERVQAIFDRLAAERACFLTIDASTDADSITRRILDEIEQFH